MKRCPTCNQTFEEDWLSFCTQDGTTLIDESLPPSEPPPTIMASAPAEIAIQHEQADWNVPPAGAARSWQPQVVTPAWQPPPPPAYTPLLNKSLATAAMVVGIISVTVGWLCLGPIPGIAAIIMGAVSLSQIKKTPQRIGGKQMAWIGVVTGGVTVLIYVGVMIFYIVAIIAANA